MKYAIEKDFPFEAIDRVAEVESYRKEINRPIYHIHKWWAKRLGSVFRAIVLGSLSEEKWSNFYDVHAFKNKVVLDPFMGSGTTLGEAAKLGANVIGCDVNPVSTFLVNQALRDVSVDALVSEYNRIEADVKERINSYYATRLPGTNEPAQALYYFWVKVVVTPSGEEVPLFSNYVFSKNAYPKKKPDSKIWCPHCESVITGRYDLAHIQCPICEHSFDPQVGPAKGAKVKDSQGNEFKIKDLVANSAEPPKHKLYAVMALTNKGDKVYLKPSQYDFEILEEASLDLKEFESDLPLPVMEVRHGHNTNQAKGYNYNKWRDFFNDRQLLCLGILLQRIMKIEDSDIRDHFVCLFSGVLEFNNLFCSFKGEGTGAVRHMFSNHILKPERTPLENIVWGVQGKSSGTFSTLFKSRLLKAKEYLKNPFEILLEESSGRLKSNKVVCSSPISMEMVNSWEEMDSANQTALILNGDSSKLDIPSGSVDAVVTDPPYFDFVHYSELSDFFYAWLSPSIGRDHEYLRRADSSHENEVQDRDRKSFSRKLGSIFSECHRVLKNEGLLCFSYHHSTVDGWMAIYEAIVGSKFDIVAAHPVKAEMSVASPKSAAKEPINIDAILICKKESSPPIITNPRQEIQDRFDNYVERFNSAGRKLTLGDLFVLACSQAISIASCLRLGEAEARELLDWAAVEVAGISDAKKLRIA